MSVMVELGRPHWRWAFSLAASPATYAQHGGASMSLPTFIRGLRSDDLFEAALQQDNVAIIDAIDFATAFTARPVPARYDRLRTLTKSYAVEEWRGSTNDDNPVFFKLLIRGGSQ